MQNDFKVGDLVRVKGAQGSVPGVIDGIDGRHVSVRYAHRPGISTHGYYPASHVELIGPETALPVSGPPSPQEKGASASTAAKPKASTKDVLS